MRAFHTTYYRPDNAVLVVVGDFETRRVDEWIDSYFGALERPASAIPRVDVVEPLQDAERKLSYVSANAPLPAIQLCWHIGAARDEEIPALDLLEAILGVGKSSRLYRSLVYDSQVATNAWAGADWNEQPGLFAIRAIAANGKTLADIEPLIDAEIELLSTRTVDAAELEKAKVQLYAATVRGRATYNEIAQTIARSAIVRGSTRLLDTDMEHYAAVDPEQLREVARRTFRRENLTVIEYLPASGAA